VARTPPVSTGGAPSWWRSRTGVAAIGSALVGTFYVLREHWGHALGTLPYLLILACPLMHLFMHRGHRHRDGGSSTAPDTQPRG
jgi:hypothetical protein